MSGTKKTFDFGAIFKSTQKVVEQETIDLTTRINTRMFPALLPAAIAPLPEPISIPEPTLRHDSKIAIVCIPQIMCPECGSIYLTTRIDSIRIEIIHYEREGCSQSNTYFIRPIATFTQFI